MDRGMPLLWVAKEVSSCRNIQCLVDMYMTLSMKSWVIVLGEIFTVTDRWRKSICTMVQ